MGKLIYILSFGHSGSTLLDLTLGTHPQMLSSGELMFLPYNLQRSLNAEYPITDGSRCSCHLKYLGCSVWSETIKRIVSKTGDTSIRDNPLQGFDMAFLRDQDFFAKGRIFDRARKWLLLSAPEFSTRGIKSSSSLVNNWNVIDTLSEVSGREYIVDSSKDVFRLLHFLRYRPDDIKVVVNIRSPFGVVNSYRKQGRSIQSAVRQWFRYYKSVVRVLELFRINPFLVNYGSFCEDPIGVSRALLEQLKIVDDELSEVVIRRGAHHMALGNGMRFQDEIRVRADNAWKDVLSFEDKEFVLGYLEKRIGTISSLISSEQEAELLSV
jgi:hypothetical protein